MNNIILILIIVLIIILIIDKITKESEYFNLTGSDATNITVKGIATQYKTEGEGASSNNLYYLTWCSSDLNKICYGEYRLRFSNNDVSSMTIQTDSGSHQGLTDPQLRFALSNNSPEEVTAILQVKHWYREDIVLPDGSKKINLLNKDSNWFDVDVDPQVIKPKQTEVIFSGNTGTIKAYKQSGPIPSGPLPSESLPSGPLPSGPLPSRPNRRTGLGPVLIKGFIR